MGADAVSGVVSFSFLLFGGDEKMSAALFVVGHPLGQSYSFCLGSFSGFFRERLHFDLVSAFPSWVLSTAVNVLCLAAKAMGQVCYPVQGL